MKKPSVVALSLGLGLSPLAFAQSNNATETIVVTATRTERSLQELGSAVSVIDSARIENSLEKSVLSLFDDVAGLYAIESGGPGGTTTIRLRGADSDQTLVLIDGVRVNDVGSAGGDFDFSTLLATDIERIEIVKGPQSSVWGSDAMGGVINIITKRGQGAPSGNVQLEGGSFDTWRGSAALRGSAGDTSYAFSAGYLDSAGFSRVDEDLGATEADGTQVLTLTGNVSRQISDSYMVELVAHYSQADSDTDPSLSSLAGDGDGSSEREVLTLQLNNEFMAFDDRLNNRVSVFNTTTDRTFFNPRNARPFSISEGVTYGGEYQGDIAFAEQQLTFGLRHQVDTGEGSTDGSAAGRQQQYDASLTTQSLYSQLDLELMENLNLTLAGRLDDFEEAGQEATYRVAVARYLPTTGTRLRASYGTGVKAPTIYQTRFNGPDPIFGGTLSGNPDLEAEISEGFDVGIHQSLLNDRIDIELGYFQQDIENLIEYQTVIFGVSSSHRLDDIARWLYPSDRQ
jgi:vitamin B12 transporter